MVKDEFERVLRELAQAEVDDAELHKRPSNLKERVDSHDRLARLRAEAARLREELGAAAPRVRRRTDGVRLFQPRP